jgi:hypothetical protein
LWIQSEKSRLGLLTCPLTTFLNTNQVPFINTVSLPPPSRPARETTKSKAESTWTILFFTFIKRSFLPTNDLLSVFIRASHISSYDISCITGVALLNYSFFGLLNHFITVTATTILVINLNCNGETQNALHFIHSRGKFLISLLTLIGGG